MKNAEIHAWLAAKGETYLITAIIARVGCMGQEYERIRVA